MLVCIPTSTGEGLNGKMFGHFGSAPFFTLYNTETEEIQVIENKNSHHSHGTCHPMNQLGVYKIDTVLCTGMGRRAVEALNAEGIVTKLSDADSVKAAIEDLQNEKAVDIDPDKACRGHGQLQEHGEHRGQGRNRGFGGQGLGLSRGQGRGRGRGQGGNSK